MTLVAVPERTIRLTTAALVLSFGAIGLMATLSASGPPDGWQHIAVTTVCATTIPVAVFLATTRLNLSWRRQLTRHGRLMTIAFVGYADVGLSAVLLTLSDREGALYGTALFAVVGVYAGYFAPRRMVTAHVVYTSLFITMMAWLTWLSGGHDAAAVAARWMVSLLSANCALVILKGFTSGVQRALDAQFTNATHDPLTGSLNRRGLDTWAVRSLGDRSHAVGFVILDVDDFKSVNDRYGHHAGDDVLELVASRLRGLLGNRAIIARIGGEEFALVLEADVDAAVDVARTVLAALHDTDDPVPITVSIGVSSIPASEIQRSDARDVLAEGLRRADLAMFQAKHEGRNRVCVNDGSATPRA